MITVVFAADHDNGTVRGIMEAMTINYGADDDDDESALRCAPFNKVGSLMLRLNSSILCALAVMSILHAPGFV